MVSNLCDLCYTRYSSADLAEKCEVQGTPEPKISEGKWVKYIDGRSKVYGIVKGHSVQKEKLIGDAVSQIKEHKLVYNLSNDLTEVPAGDQSSYWVEGQHRNVLEERCTVLSDEEAEIAAAVRKKVEMGRGVQLHSIDFLLAQTDFREYLK